jgi:uncharacterized membrane protein
VTGFGAWLAAAAGLDPAGFDHWRFLFGRSPAGWPLAAAGLALALYLWLAWRAARRIEGPGRRAALLVLRAGAALLLAAVLFDPAVEFLKTKRREQGFAVLVDTSRSMGLRTAGGERRADVVAAHMRESAAVFDALEKRYAVSYYAFDALARPVSRAEAAARKPEGGQTQIGESIDDLLRLQAADPPAGVLLYSDGADRGRIRAALAGGDQLAGVPVYPVLLPEKTPPDAAVTDLVSDPYAFVRNGFDLRARISLRGLKVRSADVTLKIDGQVAATQSVTLPEKGDEAEAVFRTTPQRVGRFVYTVEIPQFEGESVFENNRRSAIVKVVRDRVRVLQVVGEPSWDERFLRRYLEKDPNVDLISFMILRTQEDLDATPENELSLIPFPTKELFTEELHTFDLVIFQNFDYRPYFNIFPGQLLDNLRRFVESDGGGFLMIGGDKSFGLGGYAGTPIASILPVELPPVAQAAPERVRPVLTADGQRHPVTSLDLPPAETEAAWRALPALEGVNLVGAARPGAVTLLRHPTRTAGTAGMPIAAVMDAGKGRSMALAADASWRWSFGAAGGGGSAAAYQRFWNNAIRWLVHDPDFGRVRLEADRDQYDPGEPVKVRCSVLDENYRPAAKAAVELTLRNRERGGAWSGLAVQELDTGVYGGEAAPGGGGVYELRCGAKIGGKSAGDDTVLVNVDPLGEELKDTAVHNQLLAELAKRSGGETIDAGSTSWGRKLGLDAEAPFEVVGRKVARVWDNGLVLALLALLWSLEWFLRRRWGGL